MMKHLAITCWILFLGLPFCLCAGETAKARDVKWDDLKASFEFEDPFAKLGEEQLLDLGLLARIQSLEKHDGGNKVTEGMRGDAAEAKARLDKQGVDVDGLFAKRREIAELRRKSAGAAVPGLDGVLLALAGFVLPLEYDGKKVTEFLLVPWVGACIHTPPPPPNQIVHVVAGLPFETKGMFEAVTVTGVMKVGHRKRELYLVDGSADINMSYSINQAAVAKYKKR